MDLNQPLAYRMRPKSLEEFVGQEHVVGQDKLLYRTIKADRLSSLILWGPPGCGKTSLAKVISETTKYKFTKINAVTSGVGDIKKAVEEVKKGRIEYRTDSFGNIHAIIGKVSFDKIILLENLNAFVSLIIKTKPAFVKGAYIKGITISSTMGPGIKININDFDK